MCILLNMWFVVVHMFLIIRIRIHIYLGLNDFNLLIYFEYDFILQRSAYIEVCHFSKFIL